MNEENEIGRLHRRVEDLEAEAADLRTALAHSLRCSNALMQIIAARRMLENSPQGSPNFVKALQLMAQASVDFENGMTLAGDLVWGENV